MKTYANTKRFITRNKEVIEWEDFIRISGKQYHMEEYGGGWEKGQESYAIWHNPSTQHFIEIRYQCPSNSNGMQYIFFSWDEWTCNGCRWK